MGNDFLITLQSGFECENVSWTGIVKCSLESFNVSIPIFHLKRKIERDAISRVTRCPSIRTWWILSERTGSVPFKLDRDRVLCRWGWCDDNPAEVLVIVLINVETVWALCKSVTGPLRREEDMSPSVFIFLSLSAFFLFFTLSLFRVARQRLSNSHSNNPPRESLFFAVASSLVLFTFDARFFV